MKKSLDPSWLYNQLPAHAARTLVGKFHATAETPWPFQDIDARLQCQMCSLSSAWMCVCVRVRIDAKSIDLRCVGARCVDVRREDVRHVGAQGCRCEVCV